MSRLLPFNFLFVCVVNLIPVSTSTQTECGLGWRNRTIDSGSVTCYWFEPASTNSSWRDVLWSCRDRGGELFEPVDAMEMRWVEGELSPERMRGGTEWHVYGHRQLYGLDAWHSGTSLYDFAYSKRVRTPKENEQFVCDTVPSECALLRLSPRQEFELSFSNCLHVDERRTIGYVCKRELNRETAPHALMRTSSCEKQFEFNWYWQPNDAVYSISRPSPKLSWYEALQQCREKGGELPTIQSVAEAMWLRDQFQRFSSSQSTPGRIFVNLHEWGYYRNGWGWSSGAPVASSGLQWASGEPDDNCDNQDNCASLAWNGAHSTPVLSDHFCYVLYPNVTIVCKRLRSSCLPSTFKEITTSRYTTTKMRKTSDSESNFWKLLWGVEIKWVLLAGGSAIVSFLVLLALMLVICCTCCRRLSKKIIRTAPNRSNSVFSERSENTYDLPDCEPRTPTPHSSGLDVPASNQNSRKKNANTTQSNKKLHFSCTHPLYPILESRNSSQSQQQANKSEIELVFVTSAPIPSPDVVQTTSPPQLDRQESAFSSHTYQEIGEVKE